MRQRKVKSMRLRVGTPEFGTITGKVGELSDAELDEAISNKSDKLGIVNSTLDGISGTFYFIEKTVKIFGETASDWVFSSFVEVDSTCSQHCFCCQLPSLDAC